MRPRTRKFTGSRLLVAVSLGLVMLVVLPSLALAHVERASYWPDPAPDTSVNPPAGGAVPAVRSLYTALDPDPPGDTHVVCQPDSITRLKASLAAAQRKGYVMRPSQPPIKVSSKAAQKLLAFNQRLFGACSYSSIQAAVNDSHNNDRVVIMPGVYTEPASRAAPTEDPACADLKETNDKGETGAVSYRYQVQCPNDQNLIAVIGREPGSNLPPQPPALDRHGIPDLGPCIRCNLEMQGSGVKPDDVTVDGGDPSLGDHANPGPNPARYSKDIGIRADRADGFVVDNLKVRHFNEHDIYVTETDGYHLDHFKVSYGHEYGVLTFVGDHALIEDCDAWGSGDAAIYPGATADLGDAVPESQRRYGTELRNCDMHHSLAGYSATDGNAIWVHDNEFYDNTLGYTTDVFTAPGHPGFPADSQLIENNNFHSNNFNPYLPFCGPRESPGPPGPSQGCSDIVATEPEPVGTGLWIAGGNHMIIRKNHFWDNWRRAVMIFAVPDQLVCGPAGVDPSQLAGCDLLKIPPSTSYNNHVYGNAMGVAPDGTKAPNGKDFWWDEFLGNTGNCFYDNTGVKGNRASIKSDPPINPLIAGQSLPGFLPENCATSIGTTAFGVGKEVELLACYASFTFDVDACPWFKTPAKP